MSAVHTADTTEATDEAMRLLVPVEVRAVGDDDADEGDLFGQPAAADLRLINKLALAPLTARELFVFTATISNSLVDAYSTHMAKSSLRNYARDAKTGVAVMNSHRTGGWGRGLELPIGRSFRGELATEGDLQTVRAGAYMRRGGESNGYRVDSVIDDIRAGIVSDVSIGFHGGRWICDACREDYFSWDCPHWAGMTDADGNVVTVTIEDAGLGEFSLVYDGATPGAAVQRMTPPAAVVRKAVRLADEGRLSPSDVRQIEEQLHTRIVPVRYVSVDKALIAARGVPSASGVVLLPDNERTDDMTGAELIAGAIATAGDDITAEARSQLEAIRAQLESAGGTTEDAARALVALASAPQTPAIDTTELERLRGQVTTLEAEAADGRAYREQLIVETLADGVRAYGVDFQSAMHERLFREPSRSIEDIREFQANFQKRAVQRLGNGGRNTAPLDPNDPSGLGAAPPEPERNLSVYTG